MEFLNGYMVSVIVGICLCVGYIVKKWVKDIHNRFIPTICGVLGLIVALWMNKWSVTPDVILEGLFSGLASTGLYEALRNHLEK